MNDWTSAVWKTPDISFILFYFSKEVAYDNTKFFELIAYADHEGTEDIFHIKQLKP